jgi:hypothetical protein
MFQPAHLGSVKLHALLGGLSVAIGAAALTITPAASQNVGTSCADCPNYSGAYSIENTTGVTINYQFRWGNKHAWKNMALASGMIETHSYPLGEDRTAKVPTPYVRFDNTGGDNKVTYTEYKMQFYAIGYAGFGPTVNKTEPKRYVFRYARDGKHLDLKAKVN